MKNFLYVLILFLVIAGCRKDDETSSTEISNTGFNPPEITVNGSILGIVETENGNPLSGVTVKLNNSETQTNDLGIFTFNNVPMNTRGAFVSVDHPQYWHASRKVFPNLNSLHYTRLTLMDKSISGQFDAQTGGEVGLEENLTVTFQANSIVDAAGNLHQGSVLVYAKPLHAHDETMVDKMPGGLHGIDQQNNTKALSSHGMLSIELYGTNGNALNLNPDRPAAIQFPLAPAAQNSAPQAVAMWHFDETTGYWREEGKADRHNNSYIGEVAHFTWWLFSEDYETVLLEGRLVNEDGMPVANSQVNFLGEMGSIAQVFSNADGIFTSGLPAGYPLALSVSNSCNSTIFALDLGTLTENTDLGDLTIPGSQAFTTTLSGNIVNCEGEPVTNGMIQVCWDQGCQYIFLNPAGEFDQTFGYCDATELNFWVFDYNTGEISTFTESAGPVLDLGAITLCDNPAELYMSLNFDGTERFYPFPYQYVQSGISYIKASDNDYSITIGFPGSTVGTYSNEAVSFNYFEYSDNNGIPLFLETGSCFFGECENLTITITQYGEPGEIIEGSYSGVMEFTNTLEYLPNTSFSGSFRVIRLQ